ncbi:GFA family protein [Pseudoroseicyclus tamaricis]|uniref:GFA family protein n=1 Tax=Pseudoroseicyclus tamaricis TaxID=2705421 RepID=A0A6B2K4W0_9RHOB|nr:GFA family protein [Pseudoroseicyclus tamaricis]NDV02902.1 GFA family protein [Pseudoroseicyclus tamaricis]
MSVTGRCLCGAVTVTAAQLPAEMSACHCEMCRKWSGSVGMGLPVPEEELSVTGEVQTYASSSFAERAWCPTCGSALWFRDTKGKNVGTVELCPGLFENAGGARLVREVYADQCPEGYAFAGDHDRWSRADYEAREQFVPEGGE